MRAKQWIWIAIMKGEPTRPYEGDGLTYSSYAESFTSWRAADSQASKARTRCYKQRELCRAANEEKGAEFWTELAKSIKVVRVALPEAI